jgi:hypothetical protein
MSRSRVSRSTDIPDEYDILSLNKKLQELESTINSLRKELTSCIERVQNVYDEIIEKPNIKETEILDINDDYEVVHPLRIIIEETVDEVVARFPEVELFAIGDTESEAIDNLKASIIELYSDLKDTPVEKLGRLPRSWLRILNKVIRPVGKNKPL